MSLSSWLAAGAGAGVIAFLAMIFFVAKLRLVMLYVISLPLWVLAYLLMFGQTGLDSLPVWLIRPLMYFTAVPAMVTVVMLVFASGIRVRNSPLNGWFVGSVAYHLTWLFAIGCMVSAAVTHNSGMMWLHALSGGLACGIAAIQRSRYSRPPASPSNN